VPAIVIVMIMILVIAAIVVVYVAYPHRGKDLPGAPWLSDAMSRGVDALPTVDPVVADAGRVPAGETARDRPVHRDVPAAH